MLPMLEREMVDKRGWASREELLDYYAISQCTPGIISVNVATLVGYNQRGFWGAAVATVGLVTPAVVIILAIASVLSNFADIPMVAHAFAGIRAAVAALICAAVINLFKSNVIKNPSIVVPIIICVCAFVAVAVLQISPIYVTVAAALIGIALYRKESVR